MSLLRRVSDPERLRQDAVDQAVHEYDLKHKESVKQEIDAHRRLVAAQKRHDKTVKAARQFLKQAETPSKLASIGPLSGVVLFEDRIQTPRGTYWLDEQTHASVETAGNLEVTRRHTLTRAAVLGPASYFTPKATKHDSRELYLIVEHPNWSSVTKLDPNKGLPARQLAAKLNVAARQAKAASERRKQRVAQARADLARVETDTAEIMAAQSRLQEAKNLPVLKELENIIRERLRLVEDQNSGVANRATKRLRSGVDLPEPPSTDPATKSRSDAGGKIEASREVDASRADTTTDSFQHGFDAGYRYALIGGSMGSVLEARTDNFHAGFTAGYRQGCAEKPGST